jgi:hypothetical protein
VLKKWSTRAHREVLGLLLAWNLSPGSAESFQRFAEGKGAGIGRVMVRAARGVVASVRHRSNSGRDEAGSG